MYLDKVVAMLVIHILIIYQARFLSLLLGLFSVGTTLCNIIAYDTS